VGGENIAQVGQSRGRMRHRVEVSRKTNKGKGEGGKRRGTCLFPTEKKKKERNRGQVQHHERPRRRKKAEGVEDGEREFLFHWRDHQTRTDRENGGGRKKNLMCTEWGEGRKSMPHRKCRGQEKSKVRRREDVVKPHLVKHVGGKGGARSEGEKSGQRYNGGEVQLVKKNIRVRRGTTQDEGGPNSSDRQKTTDKWMRGHNKRKKKARG